MVLATGDGHYLETLRRFATVLQHLQIENGDATGGFASTSENVYFDCQAAAVIAMARAAIAANEPQFAYSAKLGLEAYHVDSEAASGEDVYVILNSQNRNHDSIHWVNKAGLLLRSLEAVEILAEQERVSLKYEETVQIRDLRERALHYIDQTMHIRGRLNEFYTADKAHETNVETQSWVALGLLPVERARSESRAQ
jgi:hypothetical protein